MESTEERENDTSVLLQLNAGVQNSSTVRIARFNIKILVDL